MNERIKQLLAQAHLDADNIKDTNWIASRFAELIVRECIGIVNKRKDAAIDADWLVDEAMSNAVWDIEEHFGVEE